MVPPMMAQLLFDDILFGQVAREEHRRFQQLMRFVADEVYDVQDLLEEVFDDEETKRAIVRDLAKRNKLGRRLTSSLIDQNPAALAEILIGGIPREKQVSGELPRFDLSPIPNYFFTRDPQVILGSGVVVCGMATRARRREALLSKYIFENHLKLRDSSLFKVKVREHRTNEARKVRKNYARGFHVLSVPDLIRDEVFVKREAMCSGNSSQNLASLFRRSGFDIFASLNQETIGVIHKNGTPGAHIFKIIELHSCCFDCGCRCRYPSRSLLEKFLCVGVGENVRRNSCALQL